MAWTLINPTALQPTGIVLPQASESYINQDRDGNNCFLLFVLERNHIQLQYHYQGSGAWYSRNTHVPYARGIPGQMTISMRAVTDFLSLDNPQIPQSYGLLQRIADFVRQGPPRQVEAPDQTFSDDLDKLVLR